MVPFWTALVCANPSAEFSLFSFPGRVPKHRAFCAESGDDPAAPKNVSLLNKRHRSGGESNKLKRIAFREEMGCSLLSFSSYSRDIERAVFVSYRHPFVWSRITSPYPQALA